MDALGPQTLERRHGTGNNGFPFASLHFNNRTIETGQHATNLNVVHSKPKRAKNRFTNQTGILTDQFGIGFFSTEGLITNRCCLGLQLLITQRSCTLFASSNFAHQTWGLLGPIEPPHKTRLCRQATDRR